MPKFVGYSSKIQAFMAFPRASVRLKRPGLLHNHQRPNRHENDRRENRGQRLSRQIISPKGFR